MGNRSFSMHSMTGRGFSAGHGAGRPGAGERVLLRNTAPVWPEKLPAFWGSICLPWPL